MKHLLITCLVTAFALNMTAQRHEQLLRTWRFSHDDAPVNSSETFNDHRWQVVTVPHDWAISGPFDFNLDRQKVAIEQNGEKEASVKNGRTGALPWIGVGWYRTTFSVPQNAEKALLNFDGAMSEPEVYVNGQKAGEWKYGYSAFNIDVTPYIYKDGRPNTLAVRLNNLPQSSRWYPGAGLYRPVTLITTGSCAIKQWGINVETQQLDFASRNATIEVTVSAFGCYSSKYSVRVSTHGQEAHLPIFNADCLGDIIARGSVTLKDVQWWSPEHPQLYDLTVSLEDGNGRIVDQKTVKYGIRTLSVDERRGFVLNGRQRKFKGVCLHHDLGMLGSAVNKAALAHQLVLLKEMGCDAIRTSHNMPSQWQMDLCDSLGLMVMAESFDMWRYPKVKNGYNRYYDQWWVRDLVNLVEANRLHPSIVMWSIGNEIPEQGNTEGTRMIRDMQNLIHRHDPTRPVTTGMDRIDNALSSGFAQVIDIPGINYRLPRYENAYQHLRHGFVLGSETASTVSSRGVYKFPVVPSRNAVYDDNQCSGYDVEACPWSNLPDEDWAFQDDMPWVIGEFVWTGFDYLGEPTPYDGKGSRSSYFGIFDLAGLPKDRYYLYRSRWNTDAPTIHLLPHWTWPGREGEITPVYCYTNYPTAELFVNGVSQGRISKTTTYNLQSTKYEPVSAENTAVLDRYRLRWNDVRYQPGELRVVVYDKDGNKAGEQVVRTAGKPDHIELTADRNTLCADGDDMAFLTARVVDKDGNLCPDADNLLTVKVTGAGSFKGICNGDATSTEVFTRPQMRAFHGQLSVGVITTTKPGNIHVTLSGKGLKSATFNLMSK